MDVPTRVDTSFVLLGLQQLLCQDVKQGTRSEEASENEEHITNRKNERAPESMLPLKCNSYETH